MQQMSINKPGTGSMGTEGDDHILWPALAKAATIAGGIVPDLSRAGDHRVTVW